MKSDYRQFLLLLLAGLESRGLVTATDHNGNNKENTATATVDCNALFSSEANLGRGPVGPCTNEGEVTCADGKYTICGAGYLWSGPVPEGSVCKPGKIGTGTASGNAPAAPLPSCGLPEGGCGKNNKGGFMTFGEIRCNGDGTYSFCNFVDHEQRFGPLPDGVTCQDTVVYGPTATGNRGRSEENIVTIDTTISTTVPCTTSTTPIPVETSTPPVVPPSEVIVTIDTTVTSTQPCTTNTTVSTTSTEPPPIPVIPPTTSTEYLTETTTKPCTRCQNPPTTAEVPPATTEVPPSFSEAPPPSTEVPPSSTDVPPDSTEVPPTSTDVPPASTEVPPDSTDVPPTSTEIPPTSTEIPPTSTEVTPTSTEVPPDSTDVPPTSTEVPSTSTEVPPTTTEVPPDTTEVPSDTTEFLSDTTEVPPVSQTVDVPPTTAPPTTSTDLISFTSSLSSSASTVTNTRFSVITTCGNGGTCMRSTIALPGPSAGFHHGNGTQNSTAPRTGIPNQIFGGQGSILGVNMAVLTTLIAGVVVIAGLL
ncbi:hypothetical protein RUND412_002212 [Rhizina undulata]